MATYLIEFEFTQKGMEKIKESPARVQAARKICGQFGGEVKSFYAVLGGEFDTMFIVEAPSEEKVAQMVLAIATLGNVRTRTLRLFREDEFKEIVAALP